MLKYKKEDHIFQILSINNNNSNVSLQNAPELFNGLLELYSTLQADFWFFFVFINK